MLIFVSYLHQIMLRFHMNPEDAAGVNENRCGAQISCRGAGIVAVCFDVTNTESYNISKNYGKFCNS